MKEREQATITPPPGALVEDNSTVELVQVEVAVACRDCPGLAAKPLYRHFAVEGLRFLTSEAATII